MRTRLAAGQTAIHYRRKISLYEMQLETTMFDRLCNVLSQIQRLSHVIGLRASL